MMRERAAADIKAGRPPGPEGSGQKLRAAAVFRRRAELIRGAQGLDGLLSTTPGNIEFPTAPSMSIRGGTDEIQRTIIGERVLSLAAPDQLEVQAAQYLPDCPGEPSSPPTVEIAVHVGGRYRLIGLSPAEARELVGMLVGAADVFGTRSGQCRPASGHCS